MKSFQSFEARGKPKINENTENCVHTISVSRDIRFIEQESHVVVRHMFRIHPLQLTQRRIMGYKQG